MSDVDDLDDSERLEFRKKYQCLLPDDSLSVTEVVRLTGLPGIATVSTKDQDPSKWISNEDSDPRFNVSTLKKHLIPPLEMVWKLKDYRKGSIRPIHAPEDDRWCQTLPLWVVFYWEDVHLVYRARKEWNGAIQWLHKVTRELESEKRTKEESSGHWADVEMLAGYLSHRWLRGDHVNLLIHLIRHKLEFADPELNPKHILGYVELSESIVKSYNNHKDTGYRPGEEQRSAEWDLKCGRKESVGGVLFVGGNHWTAYVINVKESYIAYGDSFGNAIPADVETAFCWWLKRMRGDERGNKLIERRQLPITRQRDTFSCGIPATNALAHHYLRGDVTLVSPKGISSYRIALVTDFINLDLEWVSIHAASVNRAYLAPQNPKRNQAIRDTSSSPSPVASPSHSPLNLPGLPLPPRLRKMEAIQYSRRVAENEPEEGVSNGNMDDSEFGYLTTSPPPSVYESTATSMNDDDPHSSNEEQDHEDNEQQVLQPPSSNTRTNLSGYFKKVDYKEYIGQVRVRNEEKRVTNQDTKQVRQLKFEEALAQRRRTDRERQQKHRAAKKERRILSGELDSYGKKIKVSTRHSIRV
jgi:hypothetical protein